MSGSQDFKFRLYIAGDGPHSAQAIANLDAICRDYLTGRYEIELIDVFVEPQRALDDHVILTPLLMKYCPAPIRKLVGTLSNRASVLNLLGIKAE